MNDPLDHGKRLHTCMESYVLEAAHTLEASAWTLRFAWLFGRRRVCRDTMGTVHLRRWRGKWYFMKYEAPN